MNATIFEKRNGRFKPAARAIAALAISLAISAPLYAQGARIIHLPPGGAEYGLPLNIKATVEGSFTLPIEARIYYRSDAREAFSYVEMQIDRYNLTGEIPARAVGKDEIVYYLTAELDGGAMLSLPVGAPSGNEPFRLPVRNIETFGSTAANAIVILSPSPGSTLTDERGVIAVSLLQSVHAIDHTRIRIFYDGKDYTSSANVTEDLVVLSIPSVRPGSHQVEIAILNEGQKEQLASWSFRGPMGGADRIEKGPVSANVTTGGSFEEISDRQRQTAFLDGRVNGSYGKLKWATKTYVTSLESKRLQPQNRYLAALEYKALALRAGDTQPRFSEFSLWGVRSRGVEASFHGFPFNLDVAQGEITRGIEGTSRFDTTWVTDPSTGDTLQSQVDPSQDSIVVAQKIDRSGRFRRSMVAVRPGLMLSEQITVSFNMMKAKDDVNSIDWGVAPKDNLVLGADVSFISPSRRMIFTTETALSLYNANISGGPSANAVEAEKFIVVNQYFDPLPTDSTLLQDDVNQVELGKKLVSELTKSAMAHRSTLTLNYFRNELKLGYKTIGRSFRSLGSPTILTDISGYSVEDRMRFLNSRLYLTLGYEAYADNVNGRAPTTSDRNIIRAAISVYSPPSYPNLNLGYRIYDRENDGIVKMNILPSGDTLYTDNRVDNQQMQYSLGLDQSFKYFNYDNVVAISWNSALSDDQINPLAATDLSSVSMNMLSKKDPVEWRGSYGLTNQATLNGRSSTDYTSYSFGGRYQVLRNKVWLSAGLGSTVASGGNSLLTSAPFDVNQWSSTPRSSTVSFTRYDLSTGVEYNINRSHLVTVNGYKAFYSDDGYTEYWSGTRAYNKDGANFIDQNDTVVRMVYTFKM